jgi:predicted O-methyltransferase YrrM
VLSAVTRDECARLAELAAGGRVLEFGSYLGRSTIALASTATTVHSIDPHNDGPPGETDTLQRFLDNLRRYGMRDRVIVHIGVSTQIAPLFQPVFDFAFIDAAHQRPYVDEDLLLAVGCLRPGGAVALHDYGASGAYGRSGNWEPFGVKDAADEFADRAGVELTVTDTTAVVVSPGEDSPPSVRARWSEAVARLPNSSGASPATGPAAPAG